MDAQTLFGRWLDLAPLKQRSKGLVRCRFHAPDRHPSLSVDLERGLFHCFTCHVSGGLREFAQLVGESIPVRRELDRPVASRPMVAAFQRATREGRWYAQWEAVFSLSDAVRHTQKIVTTARELATLLGPDHPDTWGLLDRAATYEHYGRQLEAGLDALYARGRLGLPPRP
jgi:hypothetical protein